MARLTNALLLDLIQTMGIRSARQALLVPMATGMTLALCLLTLKKQRNATAKYVLWSRIDQKSCFKAITTANLVPVIIDTVPTPDGLQTDTAEFMRKVAELGAENIVCIYSTSSCFAPRQCDDIVALGRLASDHKIPHLLNNAYGLQSRWICRQIERIPAEGGRLDLFVQSTDKNLLVPVGGAVVCAFADDDDGGMVDKVSENYAGRASAAQTVDVFMTLLSLGKVGYERLVNERELLLEQLKIELGKLDVTLMSVKRNPISLAVELTEYGEVAHSFGSMLYKRGVSGARVIIADDDGAQTTKKTMEIDGHIFKGNIK